MVPVIIPVFNRPEYSQVCLDSLFEADHGCCIWPIVVDNGSRNRTKRVLENCLGRHDASNRQVNKPSVLTLPQNGGFSSAVNAGLELALKHSSGNPIVVLHNDCVLFDGWAREMLECLKSEDEEVAVVVPRTNYANEHAACIEALRTAFLNIKPNNKMRISPEELRTLLGKLYPMGRKEFAQQLQKKADTRTTYSPEIMSFCMMIRRDIAEKYPTWDTDFFPRGYEDKFWFLPLERMGYVCMICNRAYVHHHGNATSDGPGYNYIEVCQANKERFVAKIQDMDRTIKKQQIGLPGGLAGEETRGGEG